MRWIRTAVLIAALAAVSAVPVPRAAQAAPTWAQVDALVKDQKLEEASRLVAQILAAAKARGDAADWTKALVRETQLRIALGSYETAVRFLKEQAWPPGLLSETTLDLFYAQALVQYQRMNSWEIGQREKVESAGAIDLKLWTRAQIVDEAEKAYRRVWDRREALGALPVGALSEFVEPNDYPPDVRGTLRDAVSYLFVELLADSALWSPEQSGDVWMLDVEGLLNADGGGAAGALAAPDSHPLGKLVAILIDLERWHESRKERAAELEARLERARRLHAAFPGGPDRAAIRQNLEAILPAYRDVSWWAMGMLTLAQLHQAEDAPNNLILAHDAAFHAFEAYPQSPGGRRANELVARIEAPEYSLTSMSSDGRNRHSIQIAHKNLSAIFFRAYRIDFDESLRANYRFSPSAADVRAMLRDRPESEWRQNLPATPDFKRHNTYSTPPMKELGAYVIIGSAREDFAEADNAVGTATLILSDLVVVTHTERGALAVRVLSGPTGTPVAGADVALWSADSRRDPERLVGATTDVHGLARFEWAPSMERERLFLVARKGDDAVPDRSYLAFGPPPADVEATRSLVYTDRAIYRPSQKILWKVVAYGGDRALGRFHVAPDAPLTMTLVDANGETVASKEAVTNAYGSAAGEFAIPSGRALGNWSVTSSLSGVATVRIEEYKRPSFEVTWSEPAKPLRLNEAATLTGTARYYFGLPVAAGTVRWTVWRQAQLPEWWWRWGKHFGSEERIVATGTARVGADGGFALSFTPAADERLATAGKDLTYIFEARADVTDEGGETRFEVRSFRLGFVSVQADLRIDSGFVRAGAPSTVLVVRTDRGGVPAAGTGRWRLVPVIQPERTELATDLPPDHPEDRFATPGDLLRPRWDTQRASFSDALRGWKDGPTFAAGEVRHDAAGRAEVRVPSLAAGVWRLRYETADAWGGTFETAKEFVVAGKATPIAFPAVLLAESDTVPVGATARLLVGSGFAHQTLFFEVVRNGRVVSRRELRSADSGVVEVPVTDADRGGFSVSVGLVRDHQFLTQSVGVRVPWDDKQLTVSFETFRDRIRPGTRETWRLKVKAPPGTPAEARAAEVLASMYDRSLDAFVPHDPPSPLGQYGDWAWDAGFLANIAPTHWSFVFATLGRVPSVEAFRADRLRFFEGHGIGGPGVRRMAKSSAGEMDALAPAQAQAASGFMGGVAAASPIAEERVTGLTPPEPGWEAPAPPTLRSDFSEPAFWKPQLLTDEDGSVVIEFQVPDSVTSWKVWVQALTKDFKAGSVRSETRSVKDLMVRPYVPRFLREGDTASLAIAVNNASGAPMSGIVTLDVLDAETNRSALAEFGLTTETASQPFSAPAGGGTTATFVLAAPRRVGAYAFVAKASAGEFSDGELRPAPVLPGRMQLSQSRFAALHGGERRTLAFPEMANSDDPSRIDEQLVVTVDAQLFYSVLNALPYLVNYPYECVEQTLNRFVSMGMVTSLFGRYPAVAKMAEELSKRDTPLEPWAAPDPTRRMALEETPWLEAARGGRDAGHGLANVLDARIATAERETSLAKLRQAQTSIGAFPWWPGGPPSPFMTLYVMYGFAKAAEFGVDVPKDVVQRGWQYLAQSFHDEYQKRMADDRCSPEWLTFLAYVATCYPDPSWMGDALTASERQSILAFSFKHWREQSPYLKGLLALTLSRSGRGSDARLVWSSVMDSSKTDRDLGTYWAPEDRSWLWYNDTIETQAFALRVLAELDPSDARRHGLVQWLFLNKKLNQWKSTRATAEVIYSLVWYLRKEGALSEREEVTVDVASLRTAFVFEPGRYTGKRNQVVVPGEKIEPKRDAEITVAKTGKGLAFASATWNFSTEKLPAESQGDLLSVSRRFYRRKATASGFVLELLDPGPALAVGDEVEVQLSVRARHAAEYVHLRDPRAAGLEPGVATSGYRWDLGIGWYEEIRDSGTNFFFEALPAGEYTLKYRVRANMAGTFRVGPATVQSMYAPEFNAYSAGATLTIR